MRISKTTRCLVVAATVALAASACTTGGYDNGDKDTITLLTHYGNDPLKSGLAKLVDQWNSENPDSKVETQAVAYEELLQTITVRQTGGQAADIVQAYSLWGGQLAEAHVLDKVPDDVATDVRDNYSKAAVGSVTVDDQVLGYPTEVQSYALFYNKKLLADAGITEPPRTWAELADAAAKTTTRDDSGNIDVAGFGLTSGWDSAVVHPFVSLLQSAGGSYMSEDGKSSAFDSKAGREALELEKQLIDDEVADPSINVLKGFPSQKIAMTVNAGWWIGTLKDKMKDDYDNIGVVALPGPDKGDKGSLAYGYFTGVNSKSTHKDKAWDFLRWLNAHKGDNGATPMGSFQFSVGTIPGRVSDSEALTGTIDDPNYQPFVEALDYAIPEPNPASGQEMKTALQHSIEAVWTGEKSIEEALSEAAAEADSSLGEG
jgi:multiple sugar transport system substrate-binding protein